MIFTDRVSEDNDDDDDDNEEDHDDDNNESSDEDNEEDDNESENEYDENQDEDNNTIMPPKLKPVALQSPKKAKSKEPQVEKLTSAVSKKLNITASPPPVKPYSMMTLDGYIVKPYTHRFVDYVEVDIHVAGPLPEHAYKVELCANGWSLIWRRAIPDYFFESKRMVSMLKNSYHPNDSRVIAQDNVVQQIRTGATESKGLHFAAAEDAMIVQLGVVCTGNVRVTEDLKKIGEVVYSGHTHFQFNTIYTCRVKTMKERTTQKRRVRRVVHDSDEDLSEEENSDGVDDDDDEEMLPVGVGTVPP
jgi:hypothetical protein